MAFQASSAAAKAIKDFENLTPIQAYWNLSAQSYKQGPNQGNLCKNGTLPQECDLQGCTECSWADQKSSLSSCKGFGLLISAEVRLKDTGNKDVEFELGMFILSHLFTGSWAVSLTSKMGKQGEMESF